MPNPFLPPGFEDFPGARPSFGDKVFSPVGPRLGASLGGAARKVLDDRKQGEKPEAAVADILLPAPADDKPKQAGLAKLLNPKWVEATGTFNEISNVTVEAVIPASLKDITRVGFTLFAPQPVGEDDRIVAAEGHAQEGEASAKFTMYHSSCRLDFEDGICHRSEP